MRDEFPKPVIRLLADRVNSICSHPNCRAPTRAPHSKDAKAINLGNAAHITAASEGGPRYDSTLTKEERAHFTNGIWLCDPCSRLIDTDPDRFPAGLLRDWKRRAEATAAHEVCRPKAYSKGRIALVSHLDRFGATTNVRIGDTIVPKAYILDPRDPKGVPTWLIGGAYVGRFKIKKRTKHRYAVLDELRVTVYERQEIPAYQRFYTITHAAETSLYMVDIDSPDADTPRTFSAEHFYDITEPRKCCQKRFSPLVLDNDIPHTVFLRMNAKRPGLFLFSVEVLVSRGMNLETHTVQAPSHIIFEPQRGASPD
jgi:hypothetical protein